MHDAKELLKIVTARFPPGEGHRHGLYMATDDVFVLYLWIDGEGEPWQLEEVDMLKAPAQIADEIAFAIDARKRDVAAGHPDGSVCSE